MTQQQFKDHLKKIESLLFGFAMKLTRNRENAKDLMQETLMRCYEKRDRFSIGTNFKAWATTVMYNSYINHYRRRKTRNKVEQPIEELSKFVDIKSIKPKVNSIIMMKELRKLVYKLSDEQRKPFQMMMEGYQYDEISDKLTLQPGTVKSRIYYARKKLRSMVNNLYNDTSVTAA